NPWSSNTSNRPTSSVRTEIPLSFKQTPLGEISDPKIPAAVPTQAGERIFRFLLDTGADISIAPRTLAEQVGLHWESLALVRFIGVERQGATAKLGRLPIRIGGHALGIRCVFMDVPNAPLALGRTDFLDHFVVTIDQPGRKI